MRVPSGVRRAFRLPASSGQIARDLEEEVEFHVAMRVHALERAGLTHDDAVAEAQRKFGDVQDLRDYCVAIEVPHMQRAHLRERLSSMGQDLRFALRQFRRSPGFAIIASLTLALGVGATTAIFSVVNGVILKPLPFSRPEQLVQLWGIDANGRHLHFADPTFDHVLAENHTLSAAAEYNSGDMSFSSNGTASRVTVTGVSKQFFRVLDVGPELGRTFTPEDQQKGSPTVIVISHGLWTRLFGGSPSVIGTTVKSGQTPITIIGVLPAGKEFPSGTDAWYPREPFGEDQSYTAHNWNVIARVKDGLTPTAATRDVSMVLRRLHAAVGEATWTFDGTAIPLRDQIIGSVKVLLLLILGASGVLLLIACANVANLLIARMAVRESEIAVRVAIGAGRGRIAQQLLIETSLLAAVGCLGGILIAAAGTRMLLVLRPALIPRVGELSLDWQVLVFAVVVSAATAVALALVAAWRGTAGDLRAALSQSQRTQGGGGASYRVRGSLVVVQLAMTVVLLIGAGLLARSFVALMSIDPGFRTHGMVVAGTVFDAPRDADYLGRRSVYYQQLAERALAIPGVTSVGISNAPPFSNGSSNGTFLVLDNAGVNIVPKELEALFNDKTRTGYATYRTATGGYFKALGIPVVTGRVFDATDRAGGPQVAVINAALAHKQWPNGDAIGKVIEFGNIDGDLTPMTVVGIVGDTREEDLAADPASAVYVDFDQRPGNSNEMFVIMASDKEGSTIAAARRSFPQVRADIPMRFLTVEDIIGRSVESQRFMLLLVGVFGAVALLLATLGVYSVISYLVAQRGREISIRVALGASASEIVGLVLKQGVVLSLVGAVIGGVAALAATRVLKRLLYQVSTTDPIAFVSVLVVLCGVALLASYVPARRAAAFEPMDVLRGG
ncbi:MAG TPA: ABC transporter permease [Gemmatimonadaceae bacterium]|nr:ABC transporter permease [Gemmatimonadaceae bacterium]